MSVLKTPKMCRLCAAYAEGECRLNPPVAIGFSIATTKQAPFPTFGWPKVTGSDWCFKFTPAPGLEEAP